MPDQPSYAVKTVLPKLAPIIRAASGLATNDINFFKSLDQGIAATSTQSSGRLLELTNSLVSSIESSDSTKLDQNSVTESWSLISNVLDTLLERSDIAFDEINGGKNKASKQQKYTYLDDASSIGSNSIQTSKRVEKPQEKFSVPVDNTESHPFKPLLTSKPHALVPLEKTLRLTESSNTEPSHFKQPYETEIMKQDYNSAIVERSEPLMYSDWDNTEATWVDTQESLDELLESLRGHSEIAVDLEHHDYRSYYGIVCLMQISTRERDWLVDTIRLRDKLQVLNIIFTDPHVTKVFHGAFMDIIWLQRDLGLYVVSLFDTYHASKQLGFPKHSLAYLLERFAHFKTSKKYQLADWRTRPLTKPMKAYARSDTHFLLYIFDNLRNQLIDANKLEKVLFDSRNVASRRFEYSAFKPISSQQNTYVTFEKDDPWKRLMYQYNISPAKSVLVEKLYNWRDGIARAEDESPRYVMPNQLLVSLASAAPTDSAGVLAAGKILTDHVRKNCKVIADIIATSLREAERQDFELYTDATTGAINDFGDFNLEAVANSEAIFEEMKASRELKFNHMLSSSSRLLDGQLGHSSCTFNAGNSETIPEDIRKRQAFVETRLAVINSSLNLELDASSNPDTASKDVEHHTTPAVTEDIQRVDASDMFADSEDVIVLKSKRRLTKADDKVMKQYGEAVDYASAPKVLSNSLRRGPQKKRKSEPFDPYAQESEGPRPAKKQAKPTQGKTMSFITKKKK